MSVNFDLNNITLEMFREMYLQDPELKKKIEEAARKTTENNFNQYKIDIQNKLKNTIPFFVENTTLFEDLEDPEKSTKLVGGLVQSGKSNVICGLAVYLNVVFNLNVVIVVRDIIADSKQLYRKFTRDFNNYSEKELRVRCIKDIKHEKDIFLSNEPSIIICIEHQKHLEKIRKNLKKDYALIADEADSVCYKDPSQKNPIRNPIFNAIKEKADHFIAITATAYDMLYMENELYSDSIYHVPIHPYYKGIDHPNFRITELQSSFDFFMRDTDDPLVWKFSKDMQRFYTRLCNQPVFEEKTEQGVFTHPVLCLQTTETDKDKQFQYLSAFASHPLFKKKITAIVYNSEGVFCYSPDGVDRHITTEMYEEEIIHNSVKPSSPYFIHSDGVVQFKKLGLGEILQYFKDRRDPPTHIVIIAGLMVGRGLNVVSTDFKWHITHQILRNSDTATCADIVQKLRLLGIYRDSIQVHLFCLQRDAIAIKQSAKLQKRIFEGADLHEELATMPDLCEEIKMYVGNIPQRRTTKKCKEPCWNRVAKEQEQYGEVMEEEKDDDENGKFYCILPQRLAPRETEIYRYAMDYLQDKTGQWIERSKIVDHAVRDGEVDNTVRGFFNSMCSVDKKKHFKTNSETQSGLLFKKSGDRWFMKLN